MKFFLNKEPESKNSVIKAIFKTNGHMFALFSVVRLILTILDCAIPVLLKEFVQYL